MYLEDRAFFSPVHSRESLARRPSAQQLHLPLLGQRLPGLVGLLVVHGQLEELVAVVGEHGARGVVHLERVGGGSVNLVQTIRTVGFVGKPDRKKNNLERNNYTNF